VLIAVIEELLLDMHREIECEITTFECDDGRNCKKYDDISNSNAHTYIIILSLILI
jgi:hypothetical protein